MDLIERVERTQATIDLWLGKEFEWGTADCAQFALSHCEALGLHTKLSEARPYTNEIGARRSLVLLGFQDMEHVIDDMKLQRIPPAAALPGDLVGLPGQPDEQGDWLSIGVHVGDGRCLAFAQAAGDVARLHFGAASVAVTAWRVV